MWPEVHRSVLGGRGWTYIGWAKVGGAEST